MDGLKYILREIETRRTLLHDFVKGIETSREFTLFSEGVPDFVRDGEITFRPNTEAEPHRKLTLRTFNSLYKKQFMESQHWSRLGIPLKPNELPPDKHEINELLTYELGGGYCQACIYMWLINPCLRQNDRKFYLIVEHRHTPRPIIEYIKGGREWTYPEGFEIDDSELEKFLIEIHPYTRWKKDARKARPRTNPVEIRAECGGQAIVHEENKIFTAPIILINEETSQERIWGQLLFYAWGHGYFNNSRETQAFKELTGYFGIKFDEELEIYRDTTRLDNIITHLRKHTFSPYDARSNLAYLKRLSKVFGREKRDLSSLPKSIPWAHQETGIPIRTIYHLVKEGKLKKDVDSSKKGSDAGDIIFLSDDAIEELKQLATQKEKHKQIRELAKLKGKSREAIKKWLQRHSDLPEEKFNKELSLWLKVRQP
ncbi:hypothetical protein ACFLVN_05240 [Chloroflexota bacterium]